MTDKAVYGVTEDGTYSTTGPAVSLSGGFSTRYAIAQLFSAALADGETVTVSILNDQTHWAVYSGAQFIAGTPNSLDLSGATLRDSAGTLSNGPVTVTVLPPWWSYNLPTDFISGLQVTVTATDEIQVSPGTCVLEDGTVLDFASTTTVSGISLAANTWYYVYAYDGGIEVSTTGPADSYKGYARSKTGDSSKRLVEILRTYYDVASLNDFSRIADTIYFAVTWNMRLVYSTDPGTSLVLLGQFPFQMAVGLYVTATDISRWAFSPDGTNQAILQKIDSVSGAEFTVAYTGSTGALYYCRYDGTGAASIAIASLLAPRGTEHYVEASATSDRPGQVAITVTTTDVTAQVNKHHVCTIAGLTAERNFILPAPVNYGAGKVADRIRVTVTDGDADYELVIKGDTGITINGGSAATEWSRLFIAGETVELEATSSTNWNVIQDGRIKQAGRLYRTSAQSVTGGADTAVQNNNVDYLIGLIADTSTSYSLKARRAGRYVATGYTRFAFSSSGYWAEVCFSIAGDFTDPRSGRSYIDGSTNAYPLITHTMPMQLAVGETVAMGVYHNASSVPLGNSTWNYPSLQLIEL